MARLKLAEVAKRINDHLKRFEADPVINALRRCVDGKWETWLGPGSPPYDTKRSWLSPYYQPFSVASGRYVYVTYVGYQGHTPLTREQAEKYLSLLDAGKVGKHFELLREVDRGKT